MITLKGQVVSLPNMDPWYETVFTGHVFVDDDMRRAVSVRLSEQTHFRTHELSSKEKALLVDSAVADAIRKLSTFAANGDFDVPYSSDVLPLMVYPDDLDRLNWKSNKPCEFRVGSERRPMCEAAQPSPAATTIGGCLSCCVPRTELLCGHAVHVEIDSRNSGTSAYSCRCDRPGGPEREADVTAPLCSPRGNSCWEVRLDNQDQPSKATLALPGDLSEIIALGESHLLEFKSTARWNVYTGMKDKKMEHVVVKTVCGFLNADGGTLLIGVQDSGALCGLDADYGTFSKGDRDGFELWMRDHLANKLSIETAGLVDVRFEDTNGFDVCVVSIPASTESVFAEPLDGNKTPSDFWVRDGNRTIQLEGAQMMGYLRQRQTQENG